MTTSKRKWRVDCLGIGLLPLDFLYTVPTMPEAGGKVDASGKCIQGGGPIPNCLVGLTRLGLTAALIAIVGDDWAGQISREHLQLDRIDQRLVRTRKNGSATAFGLIEEGSGRRTIAMHRRLGLRPADVRLSELPETRLIHMDGRDVEADLKLARWGRQRGVPIAMDIGSVRNDVTKLLPLIDHLVVADAYAFPYTGARTARGAIKRLRQVCRGTIVVTEGIRGSTGFDGEKFHSQKAFRVESVDTTGAGDAFHAGYFYGLLGGQDLASRLRLGAATAALKCTQPGARAGAPRLQKVQRFLNNHPKTYA